MGEPFHSFTIRLKKLYSQYLCCEKGFVVTAIGKVVNKLISMLYVTVKAGTDAENAKCKAVRSRAFSVMRMTR